MSPLVLVNFVIGCRSAESGADFGEPCGLVDTVALESVVDSDLLVEMDGRRLALDAIVGNWSAAVSCDDGSVDTFEGVFLAADDTALHVESWGGCGDDDYSLLGGALPVEVSRPATLSSVSSLEFRVWSLERSVWLSLSDAETEWVIEVEGELPIRSSYWSGSTVAVWETTAAESYPTPQDCTISSWSKAGE